MKPIQTVRPDEPDKPDEPDEHFRAALRHAPDADVSAPADISAQILAAAHRSAGEQPAPPASSRAARGRWWLQPWGASGALATVLMAGVVGLMWRGEAPGPAREEAAPQVAQVPVTAPLPTTTAAPTTADAQATPPAPAPALATPPAATQPRVLAAAPAVKPPTKTAAQPMAPEPSETVASARDAAAAVAAAAPVQAAPTAPAAPPPPPAAAANLRAAQRAAQEQSAAAPPTAAAPAAVARLRAPAGASIAPQPPWRTAPQPGDPMTWQPADRLLPPDAAWFARLAELSAGRWQPLAAAPASADIAQLHWQRSEATVARFGFDRSSVWWCGSEGRCERAPLDAATVLNLLDQLAR